MNIPIWNLIKLNNWLLFKRNLIITLKYKINILAIYLLILEIFSKIFHKTKIFNQINMRNTGKEKF